MSDSIKKQAIDRVMEILTTLKEQGDFRLIERKRTLLLMEPTLPAIHLVAGQEIHIEGDEDFRGYTFQFPLFIRVMFSANQKPHETDDKLQALIEQKIESDVQLNGLVNRIIPEGLLPFTNEVQKPEGGFVITYTLEYRRVKADPYTKY